MSEQKPQLSVIVSTYNRPKYLGYITQMLRQQEGVELEVIVADDGSHSPLEKSNSIDTYIWRRDDGFHKGWCINRAVSLASSDNLIFLDDDTLPKNRTWALGHQRTLKESDVSRGPFHIARLNSEGVAVTKHRRIFGLQGSYYATTNTAMRKQVFLDLGGIDDAFDGHYGYEDVDLGIRIKRAGLSVGYTGDESVAVHVGKPYMHDENEQADETLNQRNAKIMEAKWGMAIDALMNESALD